MAVPGSRQWYPRLNVCGNLYCKMKQVTHQIRIQEFASSSKELLCSMQDIYCTFLRWLTLEITIWTSLNLALGFKIQTKSHFRFGLTFTVELRVFSSVARKHKTNADVLHKMKTKRSLLNTIKKKEMSIFWTYNKRRWDTTIADGRKDKW